MLKLLLGRQFSTNRFYVVAAAMLGAVLLFIALGNLVIALEYSAFEKSFLVRTMLVAMPWLAFGVALLFALITVRTAYAIEHVADRLRAINKTKDADGRIDAPSDNSLKAMVGEINYLLTEIKQKDQQIESMKKVIEQKEQEDQLLWLQIEHNLCLAKEEAERDVLTGLYNRKAVEEKFDSELRRAQQNDSPLSVLMADLDHFKRVNDTYGHQIGDEVLKVFANTVVNSTRASDVPARYGGEEFIILLPDTAAEDAIRVAQRLSLKFMQAVERELALHVGIRCTVSIGVADYPKCASEKNLLIANADAALFEAKERGRNCVVYYGDTQSVKSKTA